MSDLVKIFRFGWPYLRRYWFRLVAGVLLGILFGASNASFVWATKTLFERLAAKSNDKLILPADTPMAIELSTNSTPRLVVTNGQTVLLLSKKTDLRFIVNSNVAGPMALLLSTNSTAQLVATNGQPFLLLPKEANMQFMVDSNAPGPIALGAIQKPPVETTKKPSFPRRVSNKLGDLVDPWLPLMGRKIDWKQIVGGLLFLPILVALRGYIGYLSSYCMAWVSERVIRDLRMDLLAKLNSLSMDFFTRAKIGELMARVNGDTMELYRCLSLGFSDLIKEPVTIIGVAAGLFWLNWKLTLLAVIFTPMTLIPISILGKKVRKAITSGITEGTMQDSLLVEVYTGIRVVKAYCLENFQLERFRRIYQNMLSLGMKGTQARELVNPTVETISMGGLGIVIIYIFATKVTVPELVGFLMGVTIMYQPIKKLGTLHVYFQRASVGATRLVEIFNQQPSVQEKPDAVRLPHFEGALKFENVSFAYEKKPVLQNLNLTVPRGMRLGIAGESGSGKSTLVNLIFRFYDPTSGRITIDGHDLKDVSVFDLRQQMAMVSQEIVIFDQTAEENIACGREGATEADVVAAAKAAFAHNFIMHLPSHYKTRVGERGNTLSVGQRQRLTIARAFVRNAPILVLDEATASLDSQSEAEVQAAIDRLVEHRTVICIAHRLSTLAGMDHIIVLKDGKIVEQDSFPNLLKANGIFADMARRQGITASGI